MSNNGSNFDKFTDSKHDVKKSSGSATPTATNLFTDNTIRTRWSTLSMATNNNNNTNNNNDEDNRVGSPLLQPPYSSIKKLDLFTKRRNIDNHSLFSDSSSSKRFKIGDDFSDSQPLSLKRSTSRVSTPSTTTSGRSFSEFRYLQHLGPISGRDSPSSNFRNLNLSSEKLNSRNESHFYSGKTTFGGANLRKTPMLHRRFSATPYSKINVKCIEPRQSAGRTNSNSPQDLPLSSVTQRILDRLEKAATPIQDAKSRIPALINQKTESREKSRLFDTPNPSLENKGRFNVDFSHKPLKYVLQTNHDIRTEREDNDESAKISDKSIERDLEKLIQIKKAEQELQRQQEANNNKNNDNNNNENRKEKSESDEFISKKNISIGKITSRDVKKGWKTESSSYVDDDHLKSLANVQPLTITSELKPIALKSTQLENNQQHSNIIDKNSDKKPFGNCDNVVDGENLHKDHESIFKFSSPKLVANLSRDVSPINEKIKFSSPLNVSSSSAETKSIFGQRSVSTGDLFKLPDQEKPLETKNSNATSLFDLFKNKKQSNLWPCPTCCTENDAKVEKCIACEEINPNHEKSSGNDASKTSISSLKFGNLSQIKSAPSVPLNQLFKKDPGNTWTCPTCSVSNNVEQNVCVSCEEPNPSKKSIDSKPNESNKIDTGFKFGSFSQTAVSDAKNQMEKPIITDISKPSLAELFKKDQNNSKKWTCQTCMVSNDTDVAKCVSCEEPNPNGGGKQAETSSTAEAKPAFGFKFGSFDGGKIDSNSKTVETSNKKPQDAATGGWKCFYCQEMNQDDTKNVCQECKKIKVMAATKDQVQKFYQFQTFKFGSKIEKENQIENIGDNVAVNSTKSNQQTSANTEDSDQSSKNETSLFKLDDVDSADKKTTSTFERQPNTFAVSNSNFPKFGAEKTKIDFKFGDKPAASGIDLAAPFKFVPPQSTNTTELKFGQNVGANKSDSNESNTKVPGLFSFGSTIAPDVTNLETIATVAASLIDSRQPSSSFKAMLDKPKVSEADSASKTVEQQQPANLLNLEPKSSGSTNESNLQTKPTLSFGFNQPAVSTTTMEAPNLFAKVASETKPEENKIKTDTPSSFQFLNASKGPSLATTSSMFTFGGPPVVSSNNAPGILPSTNTNAFGKNLDFGSPITVPKIDPGPPVSNPKININFSQAPPPVATTTAAPAPPSMFDFSANSSAAKPATQFNFGNSSTINLNNANNNGGAVFGSVPPTFNFMGNTNNVQQSNSLFSFGSKPNEANQTSIAKPETGFSFAASNPLSFGMTNPNANPIGPAGGMVPAQPSPFNPTAIDVQQQQPPSMFTFQPLQNNADFQANQRKFKKAKRRLNK